MCIVYGFSVFDFVFFFLFAFFLFDVCSFYQCKLMFSILVNVVVFLVLLVKLECLAAQSMLVLCCWMSNNNNKHIVLRKNFKNSSFQIPKRGTDKHDPQRHFILSLCCCFFSLKLKCVCKKLLRKIFYKRKKCTAKKNEPMFERCDMNLSVSVKINNVRGIKLKEKNVQRIYGFCQ